MIMVVIVPWGIIVSPIIIPVIVRLIHCYADSRLIKSVLRNDAGIQADCGGND